MTPETNDMRQRRLSDSAAALAVEVAALNTRLEESASRIETLTKQNAELDAKNTRNRAWIGATVAGLVLDLVLSVVVLLFFDQNARTTNRLERSVHEQCVFNALILSSYRPQSRPPEDREAYDRAFDRMRESYRVLECDEPIIPPAISR